LQKLSIQGTIHAQLQITWVSALQKKWKNVTTCTTTDFKNAKKRKENQLLFN
jgi:hypothetical protein